MSIEGPLLTHVPKTWDDTSVLSHSLFKLTNQDIIAQKTVKKIVKCPRSCMVVRIWLSLAFDPTRSPAKRVPDAVRTVNAHTVLILLEFYICLRDNGYTSALALLNEVRTKLGQAMLVADPRRANGTSSRSQGRITKAQSLIRRQISKGVKLEEEDIATKAPTIEERVQLVKRLHGMKGEEQLEHQFLSRVGTTFRSNLMADCSVLSPSTFAFIAELTSSETPSSSTRLTIVSTAPLLTRQEMPKITKNAQKTAKISGEESLVNPLASTVIELVSVKNESSPLGKPHNLLTVGVETSSTRPDTLLGFDGFHPVQCDARIPNLANPSYESSAETPPQPPNVVSKRQKVAHHSSYEELKIKAEDHEEVNLHTLPPQPLPNEISAGAPSSPRRPKNRSRNRFRPMGGMGTDWSLSCPSQRKPPAVQVTLPAAPTDSDPDGSDLGPSQAGENDRETQSGDMSVRAGSTIYRMITPAQSPIPKVEPPSFNSVSLPINGLMESECMHPSSNLNMSLGRIVDDEPFKYAKPESSLTPPLDFVLDARYPKPKLPHLPPIWAESRQEICEGFDWFRSYQGGVYHADNTVKGYMLGGFAARRDVFEHGGRFIISHGGGKAESVLCRDGLYRSAQASDQLADDKSVRALLDNYWTGRPLVLVIDDKYVLFPYDLTAHNVTYAVLGFYTIAYAWAEYQMANNENGRVVRYKFAFQWCEEQGDPWWLDKLIDEHVPGAENSPQSAEPSTPEKNLSTVISAGLPGKISETDLYSNNFSLLRHSDDILRICAVCQVPSPNIYSSWFCLEPDCKMFWRNSIDRELVEDPGEYRPDFLRLIPQRAQLEDLVLLPEPMAVAKGEPLTGYAFTRGVHCPKCGRLSCRFQWEKLFCSHCSWEQQADIPHRSAEDLRAGRLPVPFEKFYLNSSSNIAYGPATSFCFENGGRGTVQTFYLPNNRGRLHHISVCNPAGMKEADEVFQRYQEQANSGELRFRRWPLRAHKCRGTLLTNYFSHNAGEPYQYVGGDANTVPFEEAPAVSDARSLIEKRIREALHLNTSFNEVLSCAYMERQRMAFHSDAEVGLGPLVAGLSLGSPALMHFRLHKRHDPGYEHRGILMTVVLRHGDILVMDGAGVQDFYEHTVVPNNFRIAATARQITRQHHTVKEETV